METPFIAVGNGELEDNANVPEEYDCPRCGKSHPVEYFNKIEKDGTKTPSKMLAYVKCKKKKYLIGLNGKMLK